MANVVLSAEKAAELAKNTIEHIEELRQRHINEFVTEEVERRNGSWFRRLFRMEPVTREEAYNHDYAKSLGGGYRSQIWMIENIWYNDDYILAHRVLNAAKHTDQVAMTVEDLDALT